MKFCSFSTHDDSTAILPTFTKYYSSVFLLQLDLLDEGFVFRLDELHDLFPERVLCALCCHTCHEERAVGFVRYARRDYRSRNGSLWDL